MRRGVVATSLLATKRLMAARYAGYLRAVEADCTKSENMAVRWAEQNYDVMMEINHALLTFCQAYFYEEMTQCPDSSSPDFSDGMDELLVRLLSAINVVDGMGRTSSAEIQVEITVKFMEIFKEFSTDFKCLILCPYFRMIPRLILRVATQDCVLLTTSEILGISITTLRWITRKKTKTKNP